jgi:hypothetical protein
VTASYCEKKSYIEYFNMTIQAIFIVAFDYYTSAAAACRRGIPTDVPPRHRRGRFGLLILKPQALHNYAESMFINYSNSTPFMW